MMFADLFLAQDDWEFLLGHGSGFLKQVTVN